MIRFTFEAEFEQTQNLGIQVNLPHNVRHVGTLGKMHSNIFIIIERLHQCLFFLLPPFYPPQAKETLPCFGANGSVLV